VSQYQYVANLDFKIEFFIFLKPGSHSSLFSHTSPLPEPRLLETTRLAAGQVHRGGIRGYGKDVSVAKSYKKIYGLVEMH